METYDDVTMVTYDDDHRSQAFLCYANFADFVASLFSSHILGSLPFISIKHDISSSAPVFTSAVGH